ncbi:MAG: HAMP domain-containing protein [Calditrichaeota bacterium]|nr:HAMP domain-containing protein [Calditrichota bacterium]
MKKIFKPVSFRFKIVTILSIVIIVTTDLSVRVYSHYLSNRIFNDVEDYIGTRVLLLKEKILYTVSQNGEKNIYSILDNFRNSDDVQRAFLVDVNGNVVYPRQAQIDSETFDFEPVRQENKSIIIKKITKGDGQFLRAVIDIVNSPQCYSCHSKARKKLGYVVIDFSMKRFDRNIAYTNRVGTIFVFFLLLVIFITVLFIHYNFVIKSLFSFKQSIAKIEKGDFDERVKIAGSDELGTLATIFNKMVDRLQQMQNELKEAHKKELNHSRKLATVGEMAASFAHELKNPLTGIYNAIEIIIKESNNEKNTAVLEEIKSQAERVTRAIDDLLDFSNLKEPFLRLGDINELVASVHSAAINGLKGRKIQINLELDESIPRFKFDRDLIGKAVENLVINAIQSTPDGGEIWVKTKFDRGENVAWVIVKDTGCGVPKDTIDKIFTPFFTTRHQGTGLGLSIAQDIVEKHFGEIFVESNNGSGAIFSFTLPVNSEPQLKK